MEGDTLEPAFSADVDTLLSPSERARHTAWIAHTESVLGDLVVRCPLPIPIPFCRNMILLQAHVLYPIPANHAAVIQLALSFPFQSPQIVLHPQ